MKKIRITDKDGIVNEFDARDVTVEEIDIPDGFKPIGVPEAGSFGYNIEPKPLALQCLDQKHAENYAEAMDVLWELWACDGVVELDMEDYMANVYQMYGDLEVASYYQGQVSLSNVTPPLNPAKQSTQQSTK